MVVYGHCDGDWPNEVETFTRLILMQRISCDEETSPWSNSQKRNGKVYRKKGEAGGVLMMAAAMIMELARMGGATQCSQHWPC